MSHAGVDRAVPYRSGGRWPRPPWRPLVLLLVIVALCVPTAPVAAAPASGASPAPSTALVGPAAAVGTPVSGGAGGYIPVAAQRVFDAATLRGRRLAAGVTRTFHVAGTGSIPAGGVRAVAVSIVGSGASSGAGVTVWAAGTSRPAAPTLSVGRGTTSQTMTIIRLRTDGRLSIRATGGALAVMVDVLGWFSGTDEITAIAPLRVLNGGLAPAGSRAVKVAGTGGVPASPGAVIVALAATSATRESNVVAWTRGTGRPADPSLVADPGRRRESIAIVTPDSSGRISVWNQRGRTHVTVTVLGWLPATSSYRPVAPTRIFGAPTTLAAGRSVDITVAGKGGVPAVSTEADAETAHSVAVVIIAAGARTGRRAPKASTLVAWPTGSARPSATSLATTASTRSVAGLTIVPLGDDGKISLFSRTGAASVRVVVVGWFAQPVMAASLVVPDNTVIPAAAEVQSIATGSGGNATVVLAAGAERVAVGDSLVIPPASADASGAAKVEFLLAADAAANTPDPAEDGMLAKVVAVQTASDGSQQIQTEPALLEEVFPEGDLGVDLGASDPSVTTVAAAGGTGLPIRSSTVEPKKKGVKVDWSFRDPDGKDDKTTKACSMKGLEGEFGPLFDMEFHVKWHGLKKPTVTALATLGATARLKLHDVSFSCGWETKLLKARVTFTAGPVPVVVLFEVGAALDVAAGLSGLDLGFDFEPSITVGVRNNEGVAEASAPLVLPTFDEAKLQVANLGAYAMADAWLFLSVKLYGIIGPRIDIGPFLEAQVTMAPGVPWWSLSMGLATKISLELDLWFKSWNWTLLNQEIPLADLLEAVGAIDDCLAMPHAAGQGEPCRETTKPTARPDGSTRGFARRIRLASAGKQFQQLTITAPTLKSGRVGMAYSADYDASGVFSDSVRWTLVYPIQGLTLNPSTGLLSGTPTAPGQYTVAVELRYAADAATAAPRATVVGNLLIKPEASATAPGDLAAGWMHGCARTGIDDSVECWGLNQNYQLGGDVGPFSYTPIQVDLTAMNAVAAGTAHSCSLGSGSVWCWGDNEFGQVGHGALETTAEAGRVAGLGSTLAVAAGSWHTCALLADHTVSCWGQNGNGQVGDPGMTNVAAPHPVAGLTDVKAIAAGGWHTCALTNGGDVYCWGSNSAGQLGHVGGDSAVPTKVAGISGVKAIAAGWKHTCAVLADGTVRCWGLNDQYQLGATSPATSAAPIAVAGAADVIAISAGGHHTCAVTGEQQAVCWGWNADGQLGNGTTVDSATPVAVPLTGVTTVAAGWSTTCAEAVRDVASATEGYACWGSNVYGESGHAGAATTTPVFFLDRY
jgi:hypothetical protein